MGSNEPQTFDSEGTSHLSVLPEHGTDEFDDGRFEQAIRDARRRELAELEQLNR